MQSQASLRKAHILSEKKLGAAAGHGWAVEEIMAEDGLLAGKTKKWSGGVVANMSVAGPASPRTASKIKAHSLAIAAAAQIAKKTEGAVAGADVAK